MSDPDKAPDLETFVRRGLNAQRAVDECLLAYRLGQHLGGAINEINELVAELLAIRDDAIALAARVGEFVRQLRP